MTTVTRRTSAATAPGTSRSQARAPLAEFAAATVAPRTRGGAASRAAVKPSRVGSGKEQVSQTAKMATAVIAALVDADKQTDEAEQVAKAAISALVAEFTELADSGVARPASDDSSLPAVWGRPPRAAERAEAEMANLAKTFVARRAVIDASISRAYVANLLGVSEQSITKQILAGRIVGVKDKGRWAIPQWQLDAGSEDGFLPGIRDLVRVFPGGPVSLSLWAQRSNVEFGDQRPRDVLAANRVDEVIDAVKGMTAAGW